MKAKPKAMRQKLSPTSLLMYQDEFLHIEPKTPENADPTGDFEKKILIIIDDILPESEEHILLDKMLQATGLSLKDIYLLKITKKYNLLPYINKIRPDKIICFGAQLDTTSSIFSSTLYKATQINDIEVLVVNNLNKIISSSDAKQALWNGLKKLLSL
jgi:hypothetical protein